MSGYLSFAATVGIGVGGEGVSAGVGLDTGVVVEVGVGAGVVGAGVGVADGVGVTTGVVVTVGSGVVGVVGFGVTTTVGVGVGGAGVSVGGGGAMVGAGTHAGNPTRPSLHASHAAPPYVAAHVHTHDSPDTATTVAWPEQSVGTLHFLEHKGKSALRDAAHESQSPPP